MQGAAKEAVKVSVRTISIPVAEVLEGGTKSEFYAALRNSLDVSRRAANTCMSRYAAADADLWSGGKCPKLYEYKAISGMFPGLTSVAASISNDTQKKYFKERVEIARGNRSLPVFRSYPFPLLRSVKMLVISDGNDGQLVAKIRLIGSDWIVRLAGGSCYRDQIRGIRTAVASNAIRDSEIWIDKSGKAIVGVACQLPRRERTNLSGTLTVSSAIDNLITIHSERSDIPFVITGDRIRNWVSERNRRYQRFRQDRKSGCSRKIINEELLRISYKFSCRMRSAIHEISARVLQRAIRKRVAKIELDFTVKSFISQFPWFELAGMIKWKCEEHGIQVVNKTMGVEEPTLDKPHVYFAYSPETHRVKIGRTIGTGETKESRLKTLASTGCPTELVILAIDCVLKSKLNAREKHFKAMFKEHKITFKTGSARDEWFAADAVIRYLREVGWLGNTGNRSQISQYLDVSSDASRDGHLQADGVSAGDTLRPESLAECGISVGDISACGAAPEVRESLI